MPANYRADELDKAFESFASAILFRYLLSIHLRFSILCLRSKQAVCYQLLLYGELLKQRPPVA